jgi:hypothetical protein
MNNLRFSRMFLALAAAALFAGCASLPSPEQMKAEVAMFQLPKLPPPDKAIVYVVRPSSLGGLVRFNVFLDDEQPASEMGFTRGSQYIHFNVAPGKHRLYSKAETAAEIEIDAKAGDIFFIAQEPAIGIIMSRNTLMKLDELPGKYHVKRLTLGTVLKTHK